MTVSDLLRCASVAAVFLAGSCAAPVPGGFADPALNHPVTVDPHYVETAFTAPSPDAGLPPTESTRLGELVSAYLDHGHGSIAVSVPDGPGAAAIIAYFGEKLASLGVARGQILVGTYAGEEGAPVRLGYLDYAAQSDRCGDWSSNVAYTLSNRPMDNFGCANQHNLAVQVADPRDLAAPRDASAANAARRASVMDKYEKGSATAAAKSGTDSAKISDVGK